MGFQESNAQTYWVSMPVTKKKLYNIDDSIYRSGTYPQLGPHGQVWRVFLRDRHVASSGQAEAPVSRNAPAHSHVQGMTTKR